MSGLEHPSAVAGTTLVSRVFFSFLSVYRTAGCGSVIKYSLRGRRFRHSYRWCSSIPAASNRMLPPFYAGGGANMNTQTCKTPMPCLFRIGRKTMKKTKKISVLAVAVLVGFESIVIADSVKAADGDTNFYVGAQLGHSTVDYNGGSGRKPGPWNNTPTPL